MNSKYLRNCLKGSIFSLASYFILLVISASLMIVFDVSKGVSNIIYKIILFGALIFGGVLTAKGNEIKGWLSGLIVGFIYFVVVTIFTSLINGQWQVGDNFILTFLLYEIVGVISGILGVNI
ncbi:MAG: TIGR04086 family membrane protein [Clostridiaceae bacterium]|nr:TIGR04086 family membrane protein [Clostridiaceae bacterium]